GPYVGAINTPLLLDASASSAGNGGPLTYAWSFQGEDGPFADATGATPSFTGNQYTQTAVGSPTGIAYSVCVRVTNSAGATDTACTPVDVKPPPHSPVARLPLVYHGSVNVPLQLDASGSSDVDLDPITYGWALQPGDYTAATGVSPTFTFSLPGTYAVCVRATDDPSANAVPYQAPAASSIACTQVDIGSTPVAPLDTTPPTLTLPSNIAAVATGTAGAAVTYTATADDPPNGPVPVVCGPPSGSTFPLGTTTVNCTATDAAGNPAHGSFTVTVTADSTAPVVDATVAGTLGSGGWYTSDVQITWTVTDPESSVGASTGCGASAVTVDTGTTELQFTCSATSLGGTGSKTVTIRRDATPPSISVSRTPVPNAAGWNDSPVTATFTCADAGSGIATCPSASVFHEGRDGSLTDTAFDKAGNSAQATISGVDVDETAPTLVGLPTTPASPHGWYNADVTIHWTCGDALSGIAPGTCPADEPIGGEGAALSATAHVSDLAGNDTAAVSATVRIDRAAPVTTALAPSEWTNAGVAVTLSSSDNLSGVAATFYRLDGGPIFSGSSVLIDDEGTHTLAYWSVDDAGNAELERTSTVLIDRTAPTIGHTVSPVPNAAGWNNSNVSVSFHCADPTSGVAFCTAVQVVTAEGGAIPIAGIARDRAGNEAHDSVLVSIDKTAPTVGVAVDRGANGSGWYDAGVVVGFSCGDVLSGIVSCPAAVTLGEGRAQSAAGTAFDAAGNHTAAAIHGVNVDLTAPTVSFTGNLPSYTAEQTVSISCTARDGLSGVASSTCAPISGPAWSFGVGQVTRSASATDLAGNIGTASVSFAVQVTTDSLCRLTMRFLQSSAKYQALPANQKKSADALGTAICQRLAVILPNLTPAQKNLFVFGYGLSVQALVPAVLLTQTHVNTLKALAA
ncbi:MAG: hypothetical protein JWM93_1419, partial [Frankiales bacterium]|nr:hypothetical protein [Frankiales bacterium]